MPASKRVKREPKIVDLLVVDRKERPIMIGEVKWKPVPDSIARSLVRDSLKSDDSRVPFVLIADSERIRLYRGDEDLKGRPIFSTETGPILSYYFGHYRDRRPESISEDLFMEIILGWLRDLSYRWRSKSELPPAFNELDGLGLVGKIQGAMFEPEVRSGAYRLRRDELPDRPDPWTGTGW